MPESRDTRNEPQARARDDHSDASNPVTAAMQPAPAPLPREIGGPSGPEPTRYGDWEKAGRCIDF
jgi:hypothetical protein